MKYVEIAIEVPTPAITPTPPPTETNGAFVYNELNQLKGFGSGGTMVSSYFNKDIIAGTTTDTKGKTSAEMM